METSKAHKIILFKKKDCKPCDMALESLDSVLYAYKEYEPYITVLQQENHPALLEAYKVKLFPTALVLDYESEEITRAVGGKVLTPRWFQRALRTIHNHRK